MNPTMDKGVLTVHSIIKRSFIIGVALNLSFLLMPLHLAGSVFAASGRAYPPEFYAPPTAPLKLSSPTVVAVDLTTPHHTLAKVSGEKITLTPATFSSPNMLTINGYPPGRAVTVSAQAGIAKFTVEAVYHTGPIRLTATVDTAHGPIDPVATFVTVGKGNPPTETRYAGYTRFGTAAEIAQASDPKGANTVILSSGLNQNLVDALTAAPLSALLKAPILLTTSNQRIGQDPLSAIRRLGAKRVILIGAVDNATIRGQLPRTTSVVGYAGANRYATSLKVALAIKAEHGNLSTLFFSSGNNANLTDALTIDPVAAEDRSPVLLLPPKGGLPSGYAQLLKSAATTYVVGAAASYRVKLPHVVALAGINRYATAALVNQRFFPHPMGVVITNADGAHLVDALTAGPLAGKMAFPMIMVSSTVIPGPTYDYLQSVSSSVSAIDVVGGSAAVSLPMESAVEEMMQ